MKDLLKKITINLGGKDVDVTPKQAKDLYEALGELIGAQKVVKEYYPYHQWVWPSQYPYSPGITWLTNSGTTTISGTTSVQASVGNTTAWYDATSNTAYLSV